MVLTAGFIYQVKNGGQEDIHYTEENRPASPPLHLATGLGIDITGFGSSISPFNYMTTDFDDGGSTENYYRMMVEQNPSNPLFLRNFAHFLFEVIPKIPFFLSANSIMKLVSLHKWGHELLRSYQVTSIM